MPTWTESEWEYVYLNPNGELVSAFKAWDDAICLIDDGLHLIPSEFISLGFE